MWSPEPSFQDGTAKNSSTSVSHITLIDRIPDNIITFNHAFMSVISLCNYTVKWEHTKTAALSWPITADQIQDDRTGEKVWWDSKMYLLCIREAVGLDKSELSFGKLKDVGFGDGCVQLVYKDAHACLSKPIQMNVSRSPVQVPELVLVLCFCYWAKTTSCELLSPQSPF